MKIKTILIGFLFLVVIGIQGCTNIQEENKENISYISNEDLNMLPSDFGTKEYSEKGIEISNDKISEAKEKINFLKTNKIIYTDKNLKDKDNYLIYRENILNYSINFLNNSMNESEIAKQYFKDNNYYYASKYGKSSLGNAELAIFYADRILRLDKGEWGPVLEDGVWRPGEFMENQV